VQVVATTFVKGRADDRVSFVVFGDRAQAAAVAHAIKTAVIGISGKSTAIADGPGVRICTVAISPSDVETAHRCGISSIP